MANTYQQMAQQRKLIYAILIVSLFTVSLVHRKGIIEPQAFALQLRESSRGQVELTSSAVRLMLTGSRGLVVTVLWSMADKRKMKHEWNELELLVNSITKLQPYFITPWRFQGWNLAFNVSVECDRPADKYYYISRGLMLLSQGERRNQGAEIEPGRQYFHGSPELRRDIGVTYQLKIGGSDEKNTMRCLLDLSCIDPARRQFARKALDAGNRFHKDGDQDLWKQFEGFCRDNPMLVRRLVDHVSCENPRRVLLFLDDNKEIPSRFEPVTDVSQKETKVKEDVYDQFPVLPRHEGDWPNPAKYELTPEPMSVYVISRTWFLYAQKPLPPPFNYFDESRPDYMKDVDDASLHRRALMPSPDEMRDNPVYRKPLMAVPIFRSDPSRAQGFIAETREEEGWFLGEGWYPTFRSPPVKWFDADVVFGVGLKYQSTPQWEKTYQMYKAYGLDNGLYLTEAHKKKLEAEAQPFREQHKLAPDKMTPPEISDERRANPGYLAHETLRLHNLYRQMTNYDAHLFQAEARRDPESAMAKRLFFHANEARQLRPPEAARLYERGAFIWMDMLLRHPLYGKISSNQEDWYEDVELEYMRWVRDENLAFFRKVLIGTAAMIPQYPYVPIPWSAQWDQVDPKSQQKTAKKFLSEAEQHNVAKYKMVRSMLSTTRFYDAPHAQEVKDALFQWSAGASMNPLAFFPNQQYWLLTTRTNGELYPPPNWRFFVGMDAVEPIRQRHSLPLFPR